MENTCYKMQWREALLNAPLTCFHPCSEAAARSVCLKVFSQAVSPHQSCGRWAWTQQFASADSDDAVKDETHNFLKTALPKLVLQHFWKRPSSFTRHLIERHFKMWFCVFTRSLAVPGSSLSSMLCHHSACIYRHLHVFNYLSDILSPLGEQSPGPPALLWKEQDSQPQVRSYREITACVFFMWSTGLMIFFFPTLVS